jgi:hypothetical protein
MSFRHRLRRITGPLLRPVLLRVLKSVSTHTVLHGVNVWSDPSSDREREALQYLAEAIRTIERHDRTRYVRLLKVIQAIVILDSVDALQLPEVGLCILGTTTVLEIPRARLSATIVHETTHARFRAAGIPIRKQNIAREETFCVRQSIDFLKRVPGQSDEVTRMQNLLETEMNSDSPWFMGTFE